MGVLDRYGEPLEVEEEHTCVNGWADEDNARPCRICRPWHFGCAICGASVSACHKLAGRCCPSCPHTPPAPRKRHPA